MRKVIVILLACTLAIFVMATAGLAQIPNYGENHYLVYDVAQTGIIFEAPLILRDQFEDLYSTNLVELDLFANPVAKIRDGFPPEQPFNPLVHQTWWAIDDFEPPRQLAIENQFELPGTWYVKDGKYLVLPASKGADEGLIPEPLTEPWNHYKCYEEISISPDPIVFDPALTLIDQFGTYSVTQLTRIFFCNPCVKEVGPDPFEIFPVVNDPAHLAVYQIEPPVAFQANRFVADQFGVREITITDPMWLVVPSLKNQAVSIESNTWGGVKSLYR